MLGRWWSIVGLMAAVFGCSPAVEPAQAPERIISPSDFALLDCPTAAKDVSCALVVAGGKRVLMGTPDGAISALRDDLVTLDAVFLFSLQARDIEGLDTIRNRTWTAGRLGRLGVYGPAGVEAVLDALNRAYQTSDALTYVANPPAGGFDAALLVQGPKQFDTGDLQIEPSEDGNGYSLAYAGRQVQIVPCDGTASANSGFVVVPACAARWPDRPYFLTP